MPDVKSYTTILFEKILPILKSKNKVHITWLIHKNEKIEKKGKISNDITILDIHDFDNAVQVIQKVKPNLVYVMPGLNAPDYALALSAKYFGIPVIGGEIGIEFCRKNIKIQFLKSLITQFFQKSTSSHNTKKPQLMGKGKFFIYKNKFLVKTQMAIKQNKLKIIKEIFWLFFMYISRSRNVRFNSKFSADLHFLDGEIMMNPLLDAGFKKSSLIVTGNPIYDAIFQDIQKIKDESKDSKKNRVLLITSNIFGFEHNWVKIKKEHMIKKVISEIKKYNENIKHNKPIELSIKIHPSGESLEEYRNLIHKIDPSIRIYQKESILELLKETDVVMSTSSGTAMVCGLLLKKPLIIHDCLQLDYDELLERELVIECKEISNIIPSIERAISFKPPTKNIDEFVKDVFLKLDGKSAERISDAIINLLDNNIQHSN
jgi:hypothetical protein